MSVFVMMVFLVTVLDIYSLISVFYVCNQSFSFMLIKGQSLLSTLLYEKPQTGST